MNAILIGEDDLEDQFILEDAFRENGYNGSIVFEKNGRKVIEHLDALESDDAFPQLIILDLNMPILNGTQALFELKNSQRYQAIPVVIYSTSNNDHEKRKCLNFGAVDYLVKPLSLDESNAMIQRFLEFVKDR